MTPGENRGRLAGLRGEARVTGLQRAGNRRAARGALDDGASACPGTARLCLPLGHSRNKTECIQQGPGVQAPCGHSDGPQRGKREDRPAGGRVCFPGALTFCPLPSPQHHSVTRHQAPLCSADRGRPEPGRGVSASLVLSRMLLQMTSGKLGSGHGPHRLDGA